jgi:hypothetical protein
MEDEYELFRNATVNVNDHRTNPGSPPGWGSRPGYSGQVRTVHPMPNSGYGHLPAQTPGYGHPASMMPGYGYGPTPGMPPYGQPPYGYPYQHPAGWNMRAIGRVIRAATPIIVSLLALPTAPQPIAASGDQATDVKASLTNEANTITYQTAIAQSVKRDEAVFAIGEAIGLLLEKGLS